MDQNQINQTQLDNIFCQAMTIADNGFTERVMKLLPVKKSTISLREVVTWTSVAALVLALIFLGANNRTSWSFSSLLAMGLVSLSLMFAHLEDEFIFSE